MIARWTIQLIGVITATFVDSIANHRIGDAAINSAAFGSRVILAVATFWE